MSDVSVIQLKSEINTFALKTAMDYRGISQVELCKNIKGLSQPNLSKFLKGYFAVISKEKLEEIMLFLNFPFSFLLTDIKPVKYIR